MSVDVRSEKKTTSKQTKKTAPSKGDTESSIVQWEQLQIRDKQGSLVSIVPNRAQAGYAFRAGKRNIVLKARQLGMTTYIAARFFLQTINRPGTLTVQVAHDQRAAESIFRS